MSTGVNKVILLGNLGADPELRYTQGGQAVLNMRLATAETYLDKNKQKQERTDWHTLVLWGPRGEALAKMLKKGSRIYVEGKLQTSSYDDKEGNKRYKIEVNVREVVLLDGRGDRSTQDAPEQPAQGAQSSFYQPPVLAGAIDDFNPDYY